MSTPGLLCGVLKYGERSIPKSYEIVDWSVDFFMDDECEKSRMKDVGK
jgi:hypothetical protein